MHDVLVRPSIGPLTATIVTALALLVFALVSRYAAGGVHGGAPEVQAIPVEAGEWTVALVAALALIAGYEPIVAPRVSAVARWLWRRIGDAWRVAAHQPPGRQRTLTGVVRSAPFFILYAPGVFLWFALRLPGLALGLVLSLVDWAFAQVLARLAGATLRPLVLRYGWFLLLVGGAGWLAHTQAGPIGLWSAVLGIVMILAVARRWSWVERDREAFLIARVKRSKARRIVRVGFGQDLRDEALLGIVLLFLLVPLLFRQVDLQYDAFGIVDGAQSAGTWFQQTWLCDQAAKTGVAADRVAGSPPLCEWIGFFGGELAKAVPLVDWSEVFEVENDSPIDAKTEFGVGLIFGLRVSLDLLLLASVLLAVQIAGRVRDRTAAFEAGELDVLDPFSEYRAFRDLQRQITELRDDPAVGLTRNPALSRFARYKPERLEEIARGAAEADGASALVETDSDSRRAALAALALSAPKRMLTHVDEMLSDEMQGRLRKAEADIRADSFELVLERPPGEAAAQLVRWLEAPETETRRRAAWRLGHVPDGIASEIAPALRQRLEVDDEPAVQAQAGLSLARLGSSDIAAPIETLARCLAQPDAAASNGSAAMTAAFALRRSGAGEEAVLGVFAEETLRARVRDALALERMDREDFARIPTGAFGLGLSEDQIDPASAEFDRWSTPQTRVEIASPFELGKFAVTRAQFHAFATANKRETSGAFAWTGSSFEYRADASYLAPGFEQEDDHPAVCVSWQDAVKFCRWLSAISGGDYRLPSEAEWEWACRGGDKPSLFWWGDAIAPEQANYDATIAFQGGEPGEWRQRTVRVDAFLPNPFGLYNVHGNVWEWCQDPWREGYRARPRTQEAWLEDGDFSLAVLRGGSWLSVPQLLRSADRSGVRRVNRCSIVGFRLARTLGER